MSSKDDETTTNDNNEDNDNEDTIATKSSSSNNKNNNKTTTTNDDNDNNNNGIFTKNETFATLCESIGLDNRLRKAIARLGYIHPTLVQSQCLSLAILQGKDLLVRARTGSGKTLAYSIPLLQKLLSNSLSTNNTTEKEEEENGFVRAIILVPTRELCHQIHNVLQELIYYCDDIISIALLISHHQNNKNNKNKSSSSMAQQEAMLRDRPNILISTPAGLLAHIQSGTLSHLKNSVQTLVVDEADLVLSFGYSEDITEIMKSMPKICQSFVMSATISDELQSLKRIVLHSPAILKLEDEEYRLKQDVREGLLTQFYLALPKRDKNLVLYVFLKLGLLKGKGLFFVHTTNGAYRLKLFLEQFHIRSAVLNSELPLRSRLNIIEHFNVGNFDYLIATDESTNAAARAAANNNNRHYRHDEEDEEKIEEVLDDDNEEEEEEEMIESSSSSSKKSKYRKHKKHKKHQQHQDSEYGVSRGLDFRGVSFVVNYDFPLSTKSYIHRIGRTARGGARGVALSFIEMENSNQWIILRSIQQSQPKLAVIMARDDLHAATTTTTTTGVGGGDNNNNSQEDQDEEEDEYGKQPSPLDFDLNEVEGFRYRVEDVGRAVTKTAIRETRAAELRTEILNSTRLQHYFKNKKNEKHSSSSDLQLLRHDRVVTHISKVQNHLKNVPDYMLPRGMQVAEMTKKRKRKIIRRQHGNNKSTDPLKSYTGSGIDLDGVADENEDDDEDDDDNDDDAAYFEEGDGVEGEQQQQGKKSRGSMENNNNNKPMLLSASDGTGMSTSGRRKWQERHGKGKYGKLSNNNNNKRQKKGHKGKKRR